jgi:hypothetical protein
MPNTRNYRITLRSCPNPDHGETLPPKPRLVVLGDLNDVLAAGRSYNKDIGGGNWSGGRIDIRHDKSWIPFAKMSYNGRVWPPGPWTPTTRPLFEDDAAISPTP